jgi:hypothetical protein
MARGRLVSRTLGSSRKFAALHRVTNGLGEFAGELYPLLIATSDDFGRQAGDALTVKLAVFPCSLRSEEEFAAAIALLHDVNLVEWYEANGRQIIQIVEFDEHQPNLHKRSESKFPPPRSQNLPGIPGKNLTQQNLIEPKGTEPKRTAPPREGTVDGFDAFWSAYPKKKSRSDAEKAWRKLAPSPELTQRILDAVAVQSGTTDWQRSDGQFIPYPASWLNARRWEDEVASPAPSRATVDWWEECKALHGGACSKRWDHEVRIRNEAAGQVAS